MKKLYLFLIFFLSLISYDLPPTYAGYEDETIEIITSETDTIPLMIMDNSAGTNGDRIQFFVTSSATAPETEITANVGDVVINTNDGSMHVKKSGAGTNTGWTEFSAPTSTLSIEKTTATIASGASQVVTHSMDDDDSRVVQVYCDQAAVPGGFNIADDMTPYDPNNYSTFDNNINNGNTTDFWYNNSSTGPVTKWIGLDNGSNVEVDGIRIYDYQPGNFFCTQFSFDHSANGTTWSAAFSTTTHAKSGAGGTVYNFTPVTNRYFRIQCDGGNSSTAWFVLHELDISAVGTAAGPPASLMSSSEMSVQKTSSTQTTVTNNTGSSRDCSISVLGSF